MFLDLMSTHSSLFWSPFVPPSRVQFRHLVPRINPFFQGELASDDLSDIDDDGDDEGIIAMALTAHPHLTRIQVMLGPDESEQTAALSLMDDSSYVPDSFSSFSPPFWPCH